MIEHDHACGFAAIIGAPNAGKSTLINALVGSKVAIVTPKVQTTRMPVRGIAMHGETQIVFVDTPGIFRPRRRPGPRHGDSRLGRSGGSRCRLLIVDAADLPPTKQSWAHATPCAILEGSKMARQEEGRLMLNKIDGMKRTDLLPLVEKFNPEGCVRGRVPGLGPERRGVADVRPGWRRACRKALALSRRPGGRYPSRLLRREVTREKDLSAPA
jgi:GTP-binding protein Era